MSAQNDEIYFVCDYIEDDVATLVADDGMCITLPLRKLPEEIAEGDVLQRKPSGFVICPAETAAREEILAQLEACKEGKISHTELTAAREALLSALRASMDSPGAIESYYSTAAISGSGRSLDAYMAAVEAVTMEQVVEAARSLQLHTVFFLKGGV